MQLALRCPVMSVNSVKCLRLNLFMYFATTLLKELLTKARLFSYISHLINLPRKRWVETLAACAMYMFFNQQFFLQSKYSKKK